MLGKLAFRNMKRSAGDYLVYTLTMTVVTALMYAFNSLIFQNIIETSEMAIMMKAMLGMATVFIVLIVAWLINYMVHFMLEKRSAEFGIYMLLGMKKKTISRLPNMPSGMPSLRRAFLPAQTMHESRQFTVSFIPLPCYTIHEGNSTLQSTAW